MHVGVSNTHKHPAHLTVCMSNDVSIINRMSEDIQTMHVGCQHTHEHPAHPTFHLPNTLSIIDRASEDI